MAIDTAERRRDVVGIITRQATPLPAAGVDAEDRAALLRSYSGFLSSTMEINGWDGAAWAGPALSVKGYDAVNDTWE